MGSLMRGLRPRTLGAGRPQRGGRQGCLDGSPVFALSHSCIQDRWSYVPGKDPSSFPMQGCQQGAGQRSWPSRKVCRPGARAVGLVLMGDTCSLLCRSPPCPGGQLGGTACTALWPIRGPVKPGDGKLPTLLLLFCLVLAFAHTGSPHAVYPGPPREHPRSMRGRGGGSTSARLSSPLGDSPTVSFSDGPGGLRAGTDFWALMCGLSLA